MTSDFALLLQVRRRGKKMTREWLVFYVAAFVAALVAWGIWGNGKRNK